MPEHDDDARVGVVSSVLAGVMVIALTAMAFLSLSPREAPVKTVELAPPNVDVPSPPVIQHAD